MPQQVTGLLPLLLLALAAAGGAGAQGVKQISVTGGTFPAQVYEAWMYGYTYVDTSVLFSYSAIGSGAGVKALAANLSSFAASDSPGTVTTIPNGDGMLIPFLAGAIVPAYNVPFNGTGPLTLDGPTLVRIYQANITHWNDPAVQALNPNLALPGLPIVLMARSDSSGSSDIFTTALAAFSDGAWTARGTTPAWPAHVTEHYENAGVSIAVRETVGAIGYVGVSYASTYGVPYAQMINKAGNTVNATLDNIYSAVNDFSQTFDGNFSAVIVDGPGQLSWPISGYTYLVFRRTSMTDCSAALYVTQFLRWIATDENAINVAGQYGFLATVQAQGVNTSDRIYASINMLECDGVSVTSQLYPYQIAYYVVAGLIILAVILLAVFQTWYHKLPFMRSTQLAVMWSSTLGALMLLCSIYVWEGQLTTASCHLQIWLTTVGSTLLVGGYWAKATRPWQYLPGYSVQDKPSERMLAATVGMVVVIDVIVCIVWSGAGNVFASALNVCSSDGFDGFFGFIIGYKGIIIIWSLVESLNTPPSRSYFGETLYYVQAFAAIIILLALFLPIIFLVPVRPNNPTRELFSPSVLIMATVVAVVALIISHKFVLRIAVTKARIALKIRKSSSFTGHVTPTSSQDQTGSSSFSDNHTDSKDVADTLGGVEGAVVAAADAGLHKDSSDDVEMQHKNRDSGDAPVDPTLMRMPHATSNGDIEFVAEDTDKNATAAQKVNIKTVEEYSPKAPRKKGGNDGNLLAPPQAHAPGTRDSKANNKTRLDKVLRNAASRLHFRSVLGHLHCTEVIDFYLACRDYRELTSAADREELATAIFSLYVQPGCANEMNLIDKTQRDLRAKMAKLVDARRIGSKTKLEDAIVDEALVPVDLFDVARAEAFELMLGIYVENVGLAHRRSTAS